MHSCPVLRCRHNARVYGRRRRHRTTAEQEFIAITDTLYRIAWRVDPGPLGGIVAKFLAVIRRSCIDPVCHGISPEAIELAAKG